MVVYWFHNLEIHPWGIPAYATPLSYISHIYNLTTILWCPCKTSHELNKCHPLVQIFENKHHSHNGTQTWDDALSLHLWCLNHPWGFPIAHGTCNKKHFNFGKVSQNMASKSGMLIIIWVGWLKFKKNAVCR